MGYRRKYLLQDCLIGLCILLMICIVLHWYRRNEIRLELTCREAEVEQYSAFDPMAYVKDISTVKAVVELPVVDTSEPGDKIAVYRIEGFGRRIERVLRVHVKEKEEEQDKVFFQ